MEDVVKAEQFLEAPDVPAEDSGLNTYYSREVVLACIQAAIDATTAKAPVYWAHHDDPSRVISAQLKERALAQGGDSAKTRAEQFSVPLFAARPIHGSER